MDVGVEDRHQFPTVPPQLVEPLLEFIAVQLAAGPEARLEDDRIVVPAHHDDYSSPSTLRPWSEIICGVHCGSQTMLTFADSTLGSAAIFCRASSAMTGPMPQP